MITVCLRLSEEMPPGVPLAIWDQEWQINKNNKDANYVWMA